MSRDRLITASCILTFAAFFVLAPSFLAGGYWVSILTLVLINILLAVSLRTIYLVGHISLGHVGFMLIGAYSSALFVLRVGLPFWAAMILGGLLCATFALALGYPFLRVRGIHFAMLTLLTAETLRLSAYHWKSLTGGSLGLLGIPSPNPLSIPGLVTVDFDHVNNYYYLTLCIVALSSTILYRLEKSSLGMKWRAIRDADKLADSIGIKVMWHKIANFAIACFFAGIAGSLFAHYQHSLGAEPFTRFGVVMSLYLFTYMVVGGETKFAGPILGAFTLTIIPELTRALGEYQPMIIGVISIFVVLFVPEGIVGLAGILGLWRSKGSQRT